MSSTIQKPDSSHGPAFKNIPAKRRSGIKGTDEKGIWLSLLDNVSRGKDLAEKQLVVLGGTPEQQREFITTLNTSSSPNNTRRPQARNRPGAGRTIPIRSNNFSLGYTYQDVLDADDDDVLARLSIYMLSNPSAAFTPLLRPLFTAKTVPDTLVTILLDWADVFNWGTELRQWIRTLKGALDGADEEVQNVMHETMEAWKVTKGGEGGFTGAPKIGGSAADAKAQSIPLGPGEWNDALGVPICVVCLNGEKQEKLEKEYGWKEGDFDFVLQWLRCVMLRHGASLLYMTSFDSNNVRTLVHSSLGIQSPLKRETVKHNVIDRDKIVIPPNWDSWGKICILREGFEMETVSNTWSVEIQDPPETEWNPNAQTSSASQRDLSKDAEEKSGKSEETTISILLSALPNPTARAKGFVSSTTANEVVTVKDTQTFLAEQAQILESLIQEDERADKRQRKTQAPGRPGRSSHDKDEASRSKASEPSAPVNINVGGIQVDAEEATRQNRQALTESATRTPPRREGTPAGNRFGNGVSTPDGGKIPNDQLKDYFAGLMRKAKGSSESPRGRSGSGSGASGGLGGEKSSS